MNQTNIVLKKMSGNFGGLRLEPLECQLRLGMVEDNRSSLQKALSAAEDKIVALRSECQFVSEGKANLEGQIRQLLTMKTD